MSYYVVRPLEPWLGPVTANRQRAPFSAGWTPTLHLLNREIEALQTPEQRLVRWVMQIDVPPHHIRNDGELYVKAVAKTPAVRVAFDSKHGPLTYATDRFTQWQDNARAIALSLEALRKVDRFGVGGKGEQYRGWTAISNRPATMTREQAAEFIAWHAGAEHGNEAAVWADKMLHDLAELQRAYYLAAKRMHPDQRGGDTDIMAQLNVALATARAGTP